MLIRAYKRFGANPEGFDPCRIACDRGDVQGRRAGRAQHSRQPAEMRLHRAVQGRRRDLDDVWEPHHSRPAGLPVWAEGPKP